MSLVHTCELNGANSFHYLTELQRHAPEWRPILAAGCRGIIGSPLSEPLAHDDFRVTRFFRSGGSIA
jgi:hypothetical protein